MEEVQEIYKIIEYLDEKAKQYIGFIEKKLNVPISIVSVGPGREETIMR